VLIALLLFPKMGVLADLRGLRSQVQADSFMYLPVAFTEDDTPSPTPTPSPPIPGVRTVNATYFNSTIVARAMGIFWFGAVTPTENSTDVRVGYNASDLVIDIRVIDQQVWYDTSPSVGNLTEWDAITLFLRISSEAGNTLTIDDYKLVAQLANSQNRENYQAFYRGDNGSWTTVDLPIVTEAQGFWQQDGGPNDNGEEDFGWMARYTIPLDSLGFTSPPHGDFWRLGVILHDRDDAAGTPISDKFWPETLNPNQPDSWGGLHFGQDVYTPPTDTPDGITTIRHGFEGAVVPDAHVGGAFNCGDGIDHWTQWGNMNYESIDPTQINIQNQTLIGDWPCFSKYFVTFPLAVLPSDSEIISATLTMYHFGNSGGGGFDDPLYSWIQVFSVANDWVDTTITWNNAPLAFENISMTRVDPLDTYPGWPGVPIHWDISKAVIAAHEAGLPLRLALYSADSEMHSGKYFYSSDSGDADDSARPYVTIYWKNP
jgi:hypothetical protein